MNGFDILAITVIALCLIRGFFKGLIGEISGIIGVITAFYGAYTYYPMITVYTGQWISGTNIANLVSFFVLFCCILVAISVVAVLIRKLLKLVFLGWVDRTFGLLFGAAKGLLIVSVVLIMITGFLPKNSQIISNSKLSPYVVQISESLSIFVSKKNRADFLKGLRDVL